MCVKRANFMCTSVSWTATSSSSSRWPKTMLSCERNERVVIAWANPAGGSMPAHLFVEVSHVDVEGAVSGYLREKADAVDRPEASSGLHAFQAAAEQALPELPEVLLKRPQVLRRGARHVPVVDAKHLKHMITGLHRSLSRGERTHLCLLFGEPQNPPAQPLSLRFHCAQAACSQRRRTAFAFPSKCVVMRAAKQFSHDQYAFLGGRKVARTSWTRSARAARPGTGAVGTRI